MKKKLVIILSLVIAIVLCVPSVPAYADSNNFKVVTNEILVSNFDDKSTLANGFYQQPQSFFEGFNVEAFNNVSSLPFNPFADGVYYALYAVSNGNLELVAVDVSSISGNFTSVYTNKGLTLSTDNISEQIPSARAYNYFFNKQNSTWVLGSGLRDVSFSRDYVRYITDNDSSIENVPAQNNKYPVTIGHTDDLRSYLTVTPISNSSLCFTNAEHVYTLENLWNYYFAPDTVVSSQITNYWAIICSSGKWVQDMNSSMIDFQMDGMTPYYDGSNVVDPNPPQESNVNHLYLTGCDAGFTKPLSLNNLNSSGGGYVYFTYNFDDWINNHSGDYTLQCNSTFYINDSSTGSIVRRNLDVSGVSIFALSELGDFVDWQNLNTTFMGYPNQVLTGNYIKGYVYSLTYNQFGILQERYAKAGAHTVGYWVVKFANMLPGVKITENNVNYQEYFNSEVPSRFDLKVSFKIIDNVSGEESGTYTKTFNMLTGVSNVDSNSIQDNENPYIPSNSDDLQLPSIGDNNGYLIETGDNNQIVNLTTPDNIKLFIDNGFQNFLAWYETSADTAYATNRFWSSMGIFEGNPATELYSEYFGFLPDDFKTLIFSCAGIGIVGGAFCILRRRLH